MKHSMMTLEYLHQLFGVPMRYNNQNEPEPVNAQYIKDEYKLIEAKKSKLSSMQRQKIINIYRGLKLEVKEGSGDE